MTALVVGGSAIALSQVAPPLVAPHLGSSIETNTAILAAMLIGWGVGSFVGGKLAGRYRPMAALASVLFGAAISAAVIWFINASLAVALDAWGSDSRRIAIHSLAILAPTAALLGTTLPLLTQAGRAISRAPAGAVAQAWATLLAGGIAGVFLTGYVLVPEFPISTVLWIVAGALGAMAALCGVASGM